MWGARKLSQLLLILFPINLGQSSGLGAQGLHDAGVHINLGETALCRPLSPRGQLVGWEGGGFESPVGQLDDDEHGHEPTSVGKKIQTLMQDITYLTVGCMCSHNENMTGIAGLVVAFTKGRHSVMVWRVVMVVVVMVVVTAVMVDSGGGGGKVLVVVVTAVRCWW